MSLDKNFLNKVRTICVVGFGESGKAVSTLVRETGKRLKVTERRILTFREKELLRKIGGEFQEGGHSFSFFEDVDLIIVSPGVNLREGIEEISQVLGIPLVGEIEFASWFFEGLIVAITGSNGKTTTSYLIHKVLDKSGRKSYLLGNIGEPFSLRVKDTDRDSIVCLEVSSFQLETISSFRPHIACFLNFSADHLDRYSDMEGYFLAKKRIFENQKLSDYALYPEGLKFKLQDIKSTRIVLEENADNFSFVRKIADIFKIDSAITEEVLSNFKGLPHRFEYVLDIKDVEFINDSKATNIDSTIWALKKLKGKTSILIAGGRDKGLDYSFLNPYLEEVKKVFLIGEAKDKIKRVLNKECILVNTLEEAVSQAYRSLSSGGVVLFSPMCSSFDMFKDYRERGDVFKQAVYKLSTEVK